MKPSTRGPIVVATDLSPASDRVLRAAAAMANATGMPLHVIHALDFPPSPYLDRQAAEPTFLGRVEAARQALDRQIARAVPPGVAVADMRLEIYAAHRAIDAYSRAVSAGLVVIGPHTHDNLEAELLGSTADRLIRTLEAPCMIVRGAFTLPLRRVLVPMDLSEPARPALLAALHWARMLGLQGGAPDRGTEAVVLHVVPCLGAPEPPFERASVPAGLNREVETAWELAGSPSNVTVREEVVWGDSPTEEILELAEREWMDLVVLATHGHGAVARALIGSTAAVVARRARCPVLLVPPRLWLKKPGAKAVGGRRAGARPTPV